MTKSICIVLPGWITKHTGGAELQSYLLSEKFVASGWAVSVITVRRKITLNESKTNSSISYYYVRKYKLKIFGIIHVLYWLLRIKSDNYYLRTSAQAYRIALKILKLLKKKVNIVYALASDSDASTRLKSSNNQLNPLLRIDNKICSFLDRNSMKAFNRIIAQTNFQKELFYGTFKIEPIVIPNSIDFPKNTLKKENIILWVGNMRAEKRPEILHKLICDIELREWELIIVGKNDGYKQVYFDQLPSNVSLVGEIPFESVNELFMRAKLLINTSELEGFSNTFLQAWYYNVLLISLKVDPDNLISQKGFGIVCSDNYNMLSKAVCKIIKYGISSFSADVKEAKKYVTSEYNIKKNFQCLTEILK